MSKGAGDSSDKLESDKDDSVTIPSNGEDNHKTEQDKDVVSSEKNENIEEIDNIETGDKSIMKYVILFIVAAVLLVFMNIKKKLNK